MKYTIEKTEQYTLIEVLVDKIDTLKTAQLKSDLTTFHAEGAKSFILDFSAVKYIDSSGLSAILLANRLCESSNGLLVLCGVCEAVMKLITITQLQKVINILPTKEEAIDAVFLNAIEGNLEDEN
ncbi:MAG: anti-sigma factor antagonist [Cytophagales bacterium]|nr:MAG: anti-sigma factor antagonist [Cytophagales bacterium]